MTDVAIHSKFVHPSTVVWNPGGEPAVGTGVRRERVRKLYTALSLLEMVPTSGFLVRCLVVATPSPHVSLSVPYDVIYTYTPCLVPKLVIPYNE